MTPQQYEKLLTEIELKKSITLILKGVNNMSVPILRRDELLDFAKNICNIKTNRY